jgi:PAS domain S-box-containing protein
MTDITAIDSHVEGSLAELLDVLGRTGDAMVAINGSFGIIAWNDAATELLGYSADQALGRSCHEILCWRDRCGDVVCDGLCPAAQTGEPDEVVDAQEVLGRSASGKTLWLSASTIVPPIELRDDCRLIHLIREVSLPPELERVIVERLGGSSTVDAQSDGRLGLDGAAIADRLFLSQATVRNHIQHILAKLGVHSRVEAVALALRRN